MFGIKIIGTTDKEKSTKGLISTFFHEPQWENVDGLSKMNDVILNQKSYIRAAKDLVEDPNKFGSSFFRDKLGPIFDSSVPVWIAKKRVQKVAELDERKDQTDALLEIFQDWLPDQYKPKATSNQSQQQQVSQPKAAPTTTTSTQSQVNRSQTTGQPKTDPTTTTSNQSQQQTNQRQQVSQPKAAPITTTNQSQQQTNQRQQVSQPKAAPITITSNQSQQQTNQRQPVSQPKAAPNTKVEEFLNLFNSFSTTPDGKALFREFGGLMGYDDVKYAIAQIITAVEAVKSDLSNIDTCLQLVKEIRGLSAVLHRHEKIDHIPAQMNAKIKTVWSDCDSELLQWEYHLLAEKSKQVTSTYI